MAGSWSSWWNSKCVNLFVCECYIKIKWTNEQFFFPNYFWYTTTDSFCRVPTFRSTLCWVNLVLGFCCFTGSLVEKIAKQGFCCVNGREINYTSAPPPFCVCVCVGRGGLWTFWQFPEVPYPHTIGSWYAQPGPRLDPGWMRTQRCSFVFWCDRQSWKSSPSSCEDVPCVGFLPARIKGLGKSERARKLSPAACLGETNRYFPFHLDS